MHMHYSNKTTAAGEPFLLLISADGRAEQVADFFLAPPKHGQDGEAVLGGGKGWPGRALRGRRRVAGRLLAAMLGRLGG